ncbi:DUF1302 family protein [Massilia dura]|uniref:DUF1302 family protein n=1 Tax=Pseudoduganella dura TaxID=321982 RepID=A0A6I3XCV7_9BURK|nr:DUF1302 family protein [Pseudoduganella dura]MUI11371.1 DUF1302 family protein [Pseudoduganella dura]GGX95717.1 hypothetical protein GCM10007386_28300 [Pseudoduganella dura]
MYRRSNPRQRTLPLFAALLAAGQVHAVDFETDNGIKMRWDNTVKYSLAKRLGEQDATLLANANTDDANRNFRKGNLISNRVDLLSEFDLRYGDAGLSITGAAWYDGVYNRSNNNDSPATSNNLSVPYNAFPGATRRLSGRRAELLNAFAYSKFEIAEAPVSVRLGRHTVLWGESLFFPDNGIAYGMAAIDGQKALSVPNTQAKEVFLPTSQISTAAVLPGGVSLEAFYQFKWRALRTPPVGSYFSPADMFGTGGESILAPVPGGHIVRGPDETPDRPQFGVALKWRPDRGAVDFGLYAVRFNEKVPRIFTAVNAAGTATYVHAYQEGVEMLGASANTSVGSLNVGAEVSYRHKTALAITGDPALAPVLLPGMNSQSVGPLGDVALFEVSGIYAGKAGSFYDNYSFAGAIAGQHLVKVSDNPAAFDATTNRNTYGVRGVLTLDFYQVLPRLDLNVPIGIGYTIKGKSVLPAGFNTYSYGDHSGDISIGVGGTFAQSWKGALTLTRFVGKPSNNGYRDRSFISATLSNSF